LNTGKNQKLKEIDEIVAEAEVVNILYGDMTIIDVM